MNERNCHKCVYFGYHYLSEKTFLYRCVDDIALTTNELKKECSYERIKKEVFGDE